MRAWIEPDGRCATCGTFDADSNECLRALCGACCKQRGAPCDGSRAHCIDTSGRLARSEAAGRPIGRASACGKGHLAAAHAHLGGGPVRVVVVDFETSGFSARNGASVITQAAARTLAHIDSGGRVSARSETLSEVCLAAEVLIDPAVRNGVVSNFSRGYSLVSLDSVMGALVTERGLLAHLLDALRCDGGTTIVCAHNARFERDFFAERLARHGVNLQTWCSAERTSVLFVDTINLFRHLDAPPARPGGRRPSMALGTLSRMLLPDAPTDTLHDAGADVQRTCDLLLTPEAFRNTELLAEELLLRALGTLRRPRAAHFAFVAGGTPALKRLRSAPPRRVSDEDASTREPDRKRRRLGHGPGDASARAAELPEGDPAGPKAATLS